MVLIGDIFTSLPEIKNLSSSDSSSEAKARCKNSKDEEDTLKLENLFYYLIKLTRVFGTFPFTLSKEGQIEFRWISWKSLYSAFMISALLFRTIVYSICFFESMLEDGTNTEEKRNKNLDYFTKTLFIMSHVVVCNVNLGILLPICLESICACWNQLQNVLSSIQAGIKVKNSKLRTQLRKSAMCINTLLGFWTLSAILTGVFAGIYFTPYFQPYFIREYNYPLSFLWIIGLPIFALQILSHLLESAFFVGFMFISMDVFGTLEATALAIAQGKNTDTPQVKSHEEMESIMVVFRLYCQSIEICKSLSDSYGFFIIFQITLMAISTITNAYFGIYAAMGEELGFHPFLPALIVPAYIIWLWLFCNSGDEVYMSGIAAGESIKQALLTLALKNSNSDSTELEKYLSILVKLSEPTHFITASKFFTINKRLFVRVMAGMITYVILLVQVNGNILQ